jgi:hypothetical protein
MFSGHAEYFRKVVPTVSAFHHRKPASTLCRIHRAAFPQASPPPDIMASNNILPSFENFLQNNQKVIAACDTTCDMCCICHDPFNSEHAPTQIRSSNGECQHVFGSTCISSWLESDAHNANRCPHCRTVLFRKPMRLTPKEYVENLSDTYFDEGDPTQDGGGGYLEDLSSLKDIQKFVSQLWRCTSARHLRTDTGIEYDTVEHALYLFSIYKKCPLYIRYEHWESAEDVARSMIAVRREPAYKDLDKKAVNELWESWRDEILSWSASEEDSDSGMEHESTRDEDVDEQADVNVNVGGSVSSPALRSSVV